MTDPFAATTLDDADWQEGHVSKRPGWLIENWKMDYSTWNWAHEEINKIKGVVMAWQGETWSDPVHGIWSPFARAPEHNREASDKAACQTIAASASDEDLKGSGQGGSAQGGDAKK